MADSVITPQKLKEIVYQLADDSLDGRYWDSRGALEAGKLIADRMNMIGLKKMTGLNGYYQDIYFPDKTLLRNIIGVLPGKSKKNELVIFSAHYDHIGSGNLAATFDPNDTYREKTNDTIYNGANDDASGIAAMLSLAEYYFRKGPQERTIVFIAFSGEEIGLYGSGSLTDSIDAKQVMAQFNLEMLGRKNEKGIKPYITGDSLSNLRVLLNRCLESSKGIKDYFIPDFARDEQLFRRSDNFTLANQGVPAHTIMLTSATDSLYHSPDDEPVTLDFSMMATIVRNIAIATQCIINSKVTPSRIGRIPMLVPVNRED
ncbi:MAG: M20/M25/M40 family metallo-hydrolase [Bacteroidota bacterium]